jgi:hypothetical protein
MEEVTATLEIAGSTHGTASLDTHVRDRHAFVFQLDKDAIAADTSIVVHLADGNGNEIDRWPATGSHWLDARSLGTLELAIVPVKYEGDSSGRVPDTSAARMTKWASHLLRQYPVRELASHGARRSARVLGRPAQAQAVERAPRGARRLPRRPCVGPRRAGVRHGESVERVRIVPRHDRGPRQLPRERRVLPRRGGARIHVGRGVHLRRGDGPRARAQPRAPARALQRGRAGRSRRTRTQAAASACAGTTRSGTSGTTRRRTT